MKIKILKLFSNIGVISKDVNTKSKTILSVMHGFFSFFFSTVIETSEYSETFFFTLILRLILIAIILIDRPTKTEMWLSF